KAIGRGPAGGATNSSAEQHAQAAKAGGKNGKPEEHGWFWTISDKLNNWIGPAGNETNP
ncbi:DNA-binding protein, partial [Salmonella enterica subsp. enterica serovar Reading]|nr:DNA-binding protein [Salmonella enterica subsp. enterica serovar Reading]